MRGRGIILLAIAPAITALIDATWQLNLNIGRVGTAAVGELPDGWRELPAPDGRSYYYHTTTRETTWTRPKGQRLDPAFHGPPLAMFTPGGGRASWASWLGEEWGSSGTLLNLPLQLEFFGDDAGPQLDEPLRRTQARRLFTRSASSESLDVKTLGVAWGMVELSSIQALCVWSIDLPDGAHGASDASLPPGTRLYCSTQIWRGTELDRLRPLLRSLRADHARMQAHTAEARTLKERICKLERGLPRAGAPTIDVPGTTASGAVCISTHGQLAIQRREASGRLLNPFENGGRMPNPFAEVSKFGIVGTFELNPAMHEREGVLEAEVAQEVEVV